jgi:hypothetical protein
MYKALYSPGLTDVEFSNICKSIQNKKFKFDIKFCIMALDLSDIFMTNVVLLPLLID